MLDLLSFMLLLAVTGPAEQVWVGRAFFTWVSVFDLFVASVFWSLAAGATLGGVVLPPLPWRTHDSPDPAPAPVPMFINPERP